MIGDLTKKREKENRFARMFPPRALKIKDQLRILGNCSNKHNYEWNKDKVKRVMLGLAQVLVAQAKKFELQLELTYNGSPVENLNIGDPDLFKLEEKTMERHIYSFNVKGKNVDFVRHNPNHF